MGDVVTDLAIAPCSAPMQLAIDVDQCRGNAIQLHFAGVGHQVLLELFGHLQTELLQVFEGVDFVQAEHLAIVRNLHQSSDRLATYPLGWT
ncbi:hypothetical protein D3C72_2052540 [compost metagenome]